MFKNLGIISLILALSGCTTFQSKALQGKDFEGKPLKSLVQAWGVPDSMVIIDGKTIYAYTELYQRHVTRIERIVSNGNIAADFCKISFLVEKETVVRYTYEGNHCW